MMMQDFTLVLSKVSPIIIFILLGVLLRHTRLIAASTVTDIKKLVVNIMLPAVLFLSFLSIRLEKQYFTLLGSVFALCILLFILGKFVIARNEGYVGFLYSGFEFGMLGIGLFGGVYGYTALAPMALLGIGHEFFIWFVYMGFLVHQKSGMTNPGALALSFLKSPVIIAIFANILLNLTGAASFILQYPTLDGVIQVLNDLAQMTSPLILMIIGYDLQMQPRKIIQAGKPVLIRYALMIPFVMFFYYYLIPNLLGLGHEFQIAILTLFLLPPPFILPLFMPDTGEEEQKILINNVLVLNTIVAILLFIGLFAYNPIL